jgi:hypothetical protein
MAGEKGVEKMAGGGGRLPPLRVESSLIKRNPIPPDILDAADISKAHQKSRVLGKNFW